METYVLRPDRRACDEVLPTSDSNATFASSKIRRLNHTLVANPPPKVGTTAKVRAPDGRELPDPPKRPRFASENEERARAAFEHYAGMKPQSSGATMPPGLAVLALADLGALEGCDAELVGRYVAESLSDAIDADRPVTYARFKSMCEVIEGRCEAGALGKPRNIGTMELVPPELLNSVAMRALFDSRAIDATGTGSPDPIDTHLKGTLTDKLMTMEAWNGMLLDAGLLATAGEDTRQTTRGEGCMTLAGACVAFARARGPTDRCDFAIAFVPDFFAAVAVVARTIGVSVGEASCRLLALGPPPHAPTLAKLSAKDYGASVGHVDDPNEAFKLDVFESDVDDLASTGLSTPDVTRGTHRPVFGATDKREAIERARACFRCLDVAHTGLVRLQELVTILGQSGAFDHLDLNSSAVWLESRLGSLCKQQGNVVKYNQFADEVTLTDVGRHVRAVLRYHPPKGTESIQTPVNVDEAHGVNKENIAALRNVFERFCAAGAESGMAHEPHPRLMDLQRWVLCARNAAVFDVGFEKGAEAVAFARSCPPGNHRLDFHSFRVAVGFVAAQKKIDAREAVQWFKRAKLSMRPSARLAQFSVVADPGVHAGVTLATTRTRPGSTTDGPAASTGSNSSNSSSGENSPKNVPPSTPRSSFTGTRKAPRPDSLRPAVADPVNAELVIAAALADTIEPPRAEHLPMVLADIGALEGLCPNRAGAAVHGAKVTLELHGDDAPLGRDDVVRASIALDLLRRSGSESLAPLTPAPPRSLKTYEDNPSFRKLYREFVTYGMDAKEKARVLKQLDATWQRANADADADASLIASQSAGWPKQSRVPRREGDKGLPLQSSCPCGNPRCSSTTHPHATWPIENDNPAKPFHANPVPYQGRELPDRQQMFAAVKPTSLGPDSREVAFDTAVGRKRNFVEARTARLYGPPAPEIDPTTGRTKDGLTYAEAEAKIAAEFEEKNGPPSAGDGDRPGTATVPGAAARAAASKQRELLASLRADARGMNHAERTGQDVMERGRSTIKAERTETLGAAAAAAAEHARRRELPSAQRTVGLSLTNFRKMCVESGLVGHAFTPAAVDVIFARSRAAGSTKVSWGEFLRAVGYVSELRGEKFGIVANALMALGKPRTHYAETHRATREADGVARARRDAKAGVRMIRPWVENLRRQRTNARGELEPMDHGWGYLTGVLTHPVLKEASVESKAPGPRRLKPGALGRTGTRMPMGMKRFLDSCEASHRNVLARLRAEVAADEVAAEKVAAEKARAFHLEEREMMERATRRTNAKDPWHFVKDLQTLHRAGYTVESDPHMIGMKDTTASGVHTLTGGSLDVLGKERSEYDVAATWDERGRRLGATWLKHTANVGVDGELPSMPFGMTTSAAESLTRVDHARPLVAERDLEMADTFARMRVDALVHGEVGTRGVDEDGRAYASLDTKKMYHSREFDRGGAGVVGVSALSAAAVRRTLDGSTRRVDPMASLVRQMREEGAVGGSSAH